MMIFIPHTESTYEIATSYLSTEEADELIKGQTNSDTWLNYEDEVKEFILMQSSLAVDGAFQYKGVKVSENQILKFPRMPLGADPEEASKSIPLNVKFAVASMAHKVSNNEAFKNVTKEQISKLTLEFKEAQHEIGADIVALLKPLRQTQVKIV